jgi:hypothetical protein
MSLLAKVTAAALAAGILFANASARPRLAPADEYFGRMKMSVLEIRNRLNDLDRRSNSSTPDQKTNILHDAGLTENALKDWEHKYPGDPWLSKDIASLARIHVHLRAPSDQWLQNRYRHYRTLLAHYIAH